MSSDSENEREDNTSSSESEIEMEISKRGKEGGGEIRIGINGANEIGASILLEASHRNNFKVVAINDYSKKLVEILKTRAITAQVVNNRGGARDLIINDMEPILYQSENPGEIVNWNSLGAEYVVETNGEKDAKLHIRGGAKKVIMAAQPSYEMWKTYIESIRCSYNIVNTTAQNTVDGKKKATNEKMDLILYINSVLDLIEYMFEQDHDVSLHGAQGTKKKNRGDTLKERKSYYVKAETLSQFKKVDQICATSTDVECIFVPPKILDEAIVWQQRINDVGVYLTCADILRDDWLKYVDMVNKVCMFNDSDEFLQDGNMESLKQIMVSKGIEGTEEDDIKSFIERLFYESCFTVHQKPASETLIYLTDERRDIDYLDMERLDLKKVKFVYCENTVQKCNLSEKYNDIKEYFGSFGFSASIIFYDGVNREAATEFDGFILPADGALLKSILNCEDSCTSSGEE